MSFNEPAISFSSINSPSSGSKSFYLAFSALVYAEFTIGTRIGISAVEGTRWMSDSSVLCPSVSSTRSSQSIVITCSSAVASSSQIYSSDHPALSILTVSNGPATGAISVTALGTNFGHIPTTITIRAGLSSCESSIWFSETSLVCFLPSVLSKSAYFSVSIETAASTSSSSFSADFQSLEVAGQNIAVMHRFWVIQSNSALQILTGKLRLGRSNCESTIWVSLTAILCHPPNGIRSSLSLIITSGISAFSSTDLHSYDLGGCTATNRSNHKQSSSIMFLYSHADFGLDHSLIVKSGRTGCESSTWVSDTAALCRVGQGLDGSSRVALTSGSQVETTTGIVSFDNPSASSAGIGNEPSTGHRQLTLHGQGLGLIGRSGGGRVGET
eukprot:766326-Hanusia_phi.AAC.1